MPNSCTDPVDENGIMMTDCFVLDKHTDLFLKNLTWSISSYEMLVHRVSRTPDDLRNHIGLITLLIREQQSEALQGALVDLFIVVGNKASALRQRILEQARKIIPASFYNNMKNRIQHGLRKTDCYPVVNSSSLGYGFSGTDLLVENVINDTSATLTEQTPLEEARECIQTGQVKQACQMLETALEKNLDDEEIATELAEIFRHARDKQALERIRKLYQQQDQALPQVWLDLEQHLTES